MSVLGGDGGGNVREASLWAEIEGGACVFCAVNQVGEVGWGD